MGDTSPLPPDQKSFVPKSNMMPKCLTWEDVESLYMCTINNVYVFNSWWHFGAETLLTAWGSRPSDMQTTARCFWRPPLYASVRMLHQSPAQRLEQRGTQRPYISLELISIRKNVQPQYLIPHLRCSLEEWNLCQWKKVTHFPTARDSCTAWTKWPSSFQEQYVAKALFLAVELI